MNKRIYFITFIAVIGGFIFGLNMAGISGAVSSIQQIFSLSDGGIGFVVSVLTIGCLIGALFTGRFADRYGRKKIFVSVSVLFVLSSAGCALSTNVYALSFFRFLAGLAVGADSVVGPIYISEMSPAEKRGRLVSYQQFAIVIGILLAYLIDYCLIDLPESWRYMLAVPGFCGILFLVLIIVFLPESERWTRTASTKDDKLPKVSFRSMFRGRVGHVVMIGTLLAAFQQITGINAVINYAPIIFTQTGVGGGIALLQSTLVGAVNMLFTIFALWLVDTKGRRTLLLWGAAGMILSLGYLTFSFMFGWSKIGVLVALLVYIAVFAASFSPVMWVVNSEIFPSTCRVQAMSFATGVSWFCTFVVVQISPWMLNQLGAEVLFGTFGILSVLAMIFVWRWIPETKGKTLEEIETFFGL